MLNVERLDAELKAALPIRGVAYPWSGSLEEVNVTYYQRLEGTVRVDWLSTPTQAQNIQASDIVAAFDDSDIANYIKFRIKAYPPIGDQLDMQYHDKMDGTTTWIDHITDVKKRFPKT